MGRLTYGGATAPWKWGGGQRDVLVSLYNKSGVSGLLPTSCRPCVGVVRLLAELPVDGRDVAIPLRCVSLPLVAVNKSPLRVCNATWDVATTPFIRCLQPLCCR